MAGIPKRFLTPEGRATARAAMAAVEKDRIDFRAQRPDLADVGGNLPRDWWRMLDSMGRMSIRNVKSGVVMTIAVAKQSAHIHGIWVETLGRVSSVLNLDHLVPMIGHGLEHVSAIRESIPRLDFGGAEVAEVSP